MTFYMSHRRENPKAHDFFFFCTFMSEAPSDASRGSVLRAEAILCRIYSTYLEQMCRRINNGQSGGGYNSR